jgi:hypothetical protein
MSSSHNFKLSKKTKIAILSNSDLNLGISLESELLNMGFNIVPYETATKGISSRTNINATKNNNNYSGNVNSTVYNSTYIPSDIVISVNIKLTKYPLATYLDTAYIRILNLEDQKLLASFQYDGGPFTLYSSNTIIEKFIIDLNKQIE